MLTYKTRETARRVRRRANANYQGVFATTNEGLPTEFQIMISDMPCEAEIMRVLALPPHPFTDGESTNIHTDFSTIATTSAAVDFAHAIPSLQTPPSSVPAPAPASPVRAFEASDVSVEGLSAQLRSLSLKRPTEFHTLISEMSRLHLSGSLSAEAPHRAAASPAPSQGMPSRATEDGGDDERSGDGSDVSNGSDEVAEVEDGKPTAASHAEVMFIWPSSFVVIPQPHLTATIDLATIRDGLQYAHNERTATVLEMQADRRAMRAMLDAIEDGVDFSLNEVSEWAACSLRDAKSVAMVNNCIRAAAAVCHDRS